VLPIPSDLYSVAIHVTRGSDARRKSLGDGWIAESMLTSIWLSTLRDPT